MLNNAVFAGSFDPFTIGHYDIVKRAAKIFDKVFVGVANVSSGKTCKISLKQRTDIVMKSVSDLNNVIVMSFDSFLVDFAVSVDAKTIVRGLRTSNDFEYEKALGEVYKSQNGNLESVYLISSHNYCHISSSIVRELAIMGATMKGYVHSNVEELVLSSYKQRG